MNWPSERIALGCAPATAPATSGGVPAATAVPLLGTAASATVAPASGTAIGIDEAAPIGAAGVAVGAGCPVAVHSAC